MIPEVFHWTLVKNSGAAFGLLNGSPAWLMMLLGVGILAVLYFLRDRSMAWALVFGGALGNLTDRLYYGAVIDFLDLRFWPVFNVADSCICLGVAWMLWRAWKHAPRSV